MYWGKANLLSLISAADSSLMPRAAISPSIIIVLLLKIDNIHKADRFCAGGAEFMRAER